MQIKKVLLITLVLSGIELSGLHAQNMYLKTQNGVQTSYILNNIKKLCFTSGNINVYKSNGNTDTYALNNIRYLNFTDLTLELPTMQKRAENLELYPNPVNMSFTLKLLPTKNPAVLFMVISTDGRTVYKEIVNGQNVLDKVDVPTLPKGFYVLMVDDGETRRTAKFIKN